MSAVAALVLAVFVPQDESRLKESWPKLVDAWKAVETYQPASEAAVLDDEFLKIAARLHGAFDAAGFFAAESEYLPQAVKAILKVRARSVFPAASTRFGNRIVMIRRLAGGGFEAGTAEAAPLPLLLSSLKKLQALKQEGLDDEDNVQDELATARKAMKSLGITADDTPAGLRRRALRLVKALALGEDYPAPAVPSPEQAKLYEGWIADLGSESIEIRETATKELLKAGELALPFARQALKSADAEVKSRARLLLGFGHAPWTQVKPQEAEGFTLEMPVVLPAPAVPPAPPKEEKEEDDK